MAEDEASFARFGREIAAEAPKTVELETRIGRLEDLVRQRGALTLWAGSDDEHDETSLSGVDLYADVPAAIRGIRNRARHPYEFYLKVGFQIVGVMPDANGPGKPDIFLAKRVQPLDETSRS